MTEVDDRLVIDRDEDSKGDGDSEDGVPFWMRKRLQ